MTPTERQKLIRRIVQFEVKDMLEAYGQAMKDLSPEKRLEALVTALESPLELDMALMADDLVFGKSSIKRLIPGYERALGPYAKDWKYRALSGRRYRDDEPGELWSQNPFAMPILPTGSSSSSGGDWGAALGIFALVALFLVVGAIFKFAGCLPR